MSKYTINEIKELMSMGFTPEQIARMSEDAPAKGARKSTGKAAPATAKPELVEFVKKDGTVKMVSAKQAAVWEAARNREHKTLDEVKAEWNAKHEAYKPSKELIAALKANPIMTRKEAKAYGFIGTKDEFKTLKVKHNVYAK